MDWGNRAQVRKGSLGEALVDAYLMTRGLVPYAPVVDGAHPFDRICSLRDKSRLFIAEVKTKARRNKYPDTGINQRHYDEYSHIQERHQVDVWIFFVDELLGKIYGNSLSALSMPRSIPHDGRFIDYPLKDRGIIYFPLEAMKDVAPLTEENVARLKDLSSRNYEYEAHS
jgi:hypothetical protein